MFGMLGTVNLATRTYLNNNKVPSCSSPRAPEYSPTRRNSLTIGFSRRCA
jgi:hypothetical protein